MRAVEYILFLEFQVLRTDPRLKFVRILNFDYELQEQVLQRYKGRLLVILADHKENKRLDGVPYDFFLKIYQDSCEGFNLKKVKGTHTVHLDEPEKVAESIIGFLETYKGVTPTEKTLESRL